MKNLPSLRKQAAGQTIVLVALSLIGLCTMAALTVDYGLMVIRANQIQRACDASALAAAWKYYNDFIVEAPTKNAAHENTAITAAKNWAVTVASQNGVTISASNVAFTGTTGSTTPKRVVVTASGTQSFFLAKIIGASSSTMTRKATAEISPVSQIGSPQGNGVAPLGITVDDFEDYYNNGTLTVTMERIQQGNFTNGEIIGMDLRPVNGKSPSHWENEVATGDTLNFFTDSPSNTAINASRGNQSTRLRDAINTRIANGKNTLYIMVTDPINQNNGTTNVPMRGIAKIEIQAISVNGQGNNALASFSMKIVGGGLIGDDDFPFTIDSADITSMTVPNGELTNSQNTSLIFKVRLIDDI